MPLGRQRGTVDHSGSPQWGALTHWFARRDPQIGNTLAPTYSSGSVDDSAVSYQNTGAAPLIQSANAGATSIDDSAVSYQNSGTSAESLDTASQGTQQNTGVIFPSSDGAPQGINQNAPAYAQNVDQYAQPTSPSVQPSTVSQYPAANQLTQEYAPPVQPEILESSFVPSQQPVPTTDTQTVQQPSQQVPPLDTTQQQPSLQGDGSGSTYQGITGTVPAETPSAATTTHIASTSTLSSQLSTPTLPSSTGVEQQVVDDDYVLVDSSVPVSSALGTSGSTSSQPITDGTVTADPTTTNTDTASDDEALYTAPGSGVDSGGGSSTVDDSEAETPDPSDLYGYAADMFDKEEAKAEELAEAKGRKEQKEEDEKEAKEKKEKQDEEDKKKQKEKEEKEKKPSGRVVKWDVGKAMPFPKTGDLTPSNFAKQAKEGLDKICNPGEPPNDDDWANFEICSQDTKPEINGFKVIKPIISSNIPEGGDPGTVDLVNGKLWIHIERAYCKKAYCSTLKQARDAALDFLLNDQTIREYEVDSMGGYDPPKRKARRDDADDDGPAASTSTTTTTTTTLSRRAPQGEGGMAWDSLMEKITIKQGYVPNVIVINVNEYGDHVDYGVMILRFEYEEVAEKSMGFFMGFMKNIVCNSLMGAMRSFGPGVVADIANQANLAAGGESIDPMGFACDAK